jgi:hypothetical protein
MPFASPALSAFQSPHGLPGATPFGFASQPPLQASSLVDGSGAGGAGGWGMSAGNVNSGAPGFFSASWNPIQQPQQQQPQQLVPNFFGGPKP